MRQSMGLFPHEIERDVSNEAGRTSLPALRCELFGRKTPFKVIRWTARLQAAGPPDQSVQPSRRELRASRFPTRMRKRGNLGNLLHPASRIPPASFWDTLHLPHEIRAPIRIFPTLSALFPGIVNEVEHIGT